MRTKKRLKIIDWYVHQGHQSEFMKLPYDFNLIGADGKVPKWNVNHRNKPVNAKFLSENDALHIGRVHFVIVRGPIAEKRYSSFVRRGAIPIAVVQTTTPFKIPSYVKVVVWNSYDVMKKFKSSMPKKKHFYIVHGYDPNQFKCERVNENNRVLTVANVFKGRSKIMGFPLWKNINKELGICDIVGHGNEDISPNIREASSFDELISIYNNYSIFLNTTIESAMPRSRAEAAMCGMPIVSTNNFDISRYFTHKKNAILTNDKVEMIDSIKNLLESKNMREDFSLGAREVAKKHFHIDDYLEKWNSILKSL